MPAADDGSDDELQIPVNKKASKRRKLNDGKADNGPEPEVEEKRVLSQKSINEGRNGSNGRVTAPRKSSANDGEKSNNMDSKFREACDDGSI